MGVLAHDFSGIRVLVTGGTRGPGLAAARQFADAGAEVTVTGTMILPSLYDADLSGFYYEQLNLARQDSIDNFVAAQGPVDVLVNAAGATLPFGFDPAEHDFVRQAVGLGMLGPAFLMTRLRMRLAQSRATGGGVVVNTASLLRWQALVEEEGCTVDLLVEETRRAGENWARIGARVNTVVEPSPRWIPRQYPQRDALSQPAGSLMVREQHQETDEAVASSIVFLASAGAARINGQTLHLH